MVDLLRKGDRIRNLVGVDEIMMDADYVVLEDAQTYKDEQGEYYTVRLRKTNMKVWVCSCGKRFETETVYMASSNVPCYAAKNQEEFWKCANDESHNPRLVDE